MLPTEALGDDGARSASKGLLATQCPELVPLRKLPPGDSASLDEMSQKERSLLFRAMSSSLVAAAMWENDLAEISS